MSAGVRKAKADYNIVEKARNVRGHAATKVEAQRSAKARNVTRHGWKATGKRTGK